MNAYRSEHRNNLKEQHSKSNSAIATELRLYAMFVNYKPASYSPTITADFDNGLTQWDIASIYKIAQHPDVINVTIISIESSVA